MQAHGEAGSPQARRQRPSPDDANRVVVQVEPPASSNQASTHARTVSRTRRKCTGAPAAGCARHSRQARRQHAGPDLADLVAAKVDFSARSNITHAHTHAHTHTHTQHTQTNNTHTNNTHTHNTHTHNTQPTQHTHTQTRSAAAVANAQVHQPQGAPGTHVTLGGSMTAPISLI